ncbi:hypothetical protein IVB12_06310 [Bradyrhizobium sp. 179]|nr:hypothetical protein [Bradyrhizobium sp. 179]
MRMDMREASAMTEASGVVDELDGTGGASGARSGGAAGGNSRPAPAPDAAMRLAERLREVTVKSPLQALFAAFLLGVWVARRR